MTTQPTKSISESERIDAFCRELGLILRRILKEADQVSKPTSEKLVKKTNPEIK